MGREFPSAMEIMVQALHHEDGSSSDVQSTELPMVKVKATKSKAKTILRKLFFRSCSETSFQSPLTGPEKFKNTTSLQHSKSKPDLESDSQHPPRLSILVRANGYSCVIRLLRVVDSSKKFRFVKNHEMHLI